MIELVNVTKEYPGTVAVKDLTFEVGDGEFCVLIGPSGCGKSTTLRMINRLIEATSGTLLIDGTDIRDYRPEELRRKIGYAIQSVGLFPHMTVAQNISVVPGLLKWETSRIDKRIGELLDLFGLDPSAYKGKYPRELSGGEAQRVGVARALAADPSILLMDEPFGALDPITRESLQNEFARIQRGLKKTIVFVTHDIDEAIRLAARILIMREGELVQYDTPENILTSPGDKFVLEFIGTDRALKRLARLPVQGLMRSASSVVLSDDPGKVEKSLAENSYLWVTDNEGRLKGWLDRKVLDKAPFNMEDSIVRIRVADFAVSPDSTAKEALSRMVLAGTSSAPVVDNTDLLVGEIRLADLLEA
jgi:osmoprotectant transport system ATP-binding protein